jgi:heme O synthase-like polyprenyltransferase
MDEDGPQEEETPKERADRELIELLNELRVVLPGVTVLLAFLLAVPFANGWTRVTGFQRDVFVVAFLSTAVSVALLTAPSSYHRLRFRQDDKEHMVKISNRLSIAGIVASAVSLEAVVVLVMDSVVSRGAAVAAAVGLFAVIALLWYGLALLDALRDRSAR